jgi:ABC-type multidrug transport system ATPase subunit
LLVSHVLAEVERLCDRVAVLREGRLIHDGAMAGLIREQATGSARPLEQALQELYTKAAA